MARRSRIWEGDLTVLVCRGCCCGRSAKHPDVNHQAQVDAIERAVESTDRARVLIVDCVGECSHSNVVVVRHRGLTGATTTTWLGAVLGNRRTRALCDWLAAGGPRVQVLPSTLAFAVFTPGRDAACAIERLD